MKVKQQLVLVFFFCKYMTMFSFIVIISLMATVRPVARHHGGDGGGHDPNRRRQLPAPCDEAGKLYKYESLLR